MSGWSGLFNDVTTANGVAGTGHAAERLSNRTNRTAAGRSITVSLRGRGGQQLRALLSAYITGTPTVTPEFARRVVHPLNALTDPGAFGAAPRQQAAAVANFTLRVGGPAAAIDTTRLNTMLNETRNAAVAAVDRSGNGTGGKAGQI